jgi:tripartite-type tricarboxylate transporter receptor subunit TctC
MAIRITAALAALCLAVLPVRAEEYPSRPITMVVPFAPGGATDVIGRIVAEGMSKALDQRVIVENVAGAGGTTGSARVKGAAPDGYTILTGHMGTHASAFSLYARPKYDPRTDFEPIGLAASAPIVLFSRKDFPAKTLAEFSEAVRKGGEAMKAGHSGVGSNAHLTCALYSGLIGAKPTQVAYRGNGPLMTDLMAGTIDFSCDQLITIAPQVAAGTVKAYAVASETRSPALPDVPTTREAGLPAYQADAWTALFAPKGTPEPVLRRLNEAYVKALDDEAVRKRLGELGAVLPSAEKRTRAALADLVAKDTERWAKVIEANGIKLD